LNGQKITTKKNKIKKMLKQKQLLKTPIDFNIAEEQTCLKKKRLLIGAEKNNNPLKNFNNLL